MIHIQQKKILIICLFTLNCVFLIILPLSHAPLASPLNFFLQNAGGQSPPPRIAMDGPHCPLPVYASERR